MFKKNLLLAVVALLFASPVWAQLPITFGPQVGINYNQLSSLESGFSSAGKAGFVGGAFVRVNLSKFYLQPSLLFSVKNSDISANGTKVSINASDLDVPVLVGYKIINLELVNVRINLGPVASFNLSNGGLDSIKKYSNNGSELVKKAVIGYKVGVGVDIAKFTFDAYYQGSFSDSFDFSGVQAGKPKNGLFQFTVGFKIL